MGGRRQTKIKGHTVAFLTRHLRTTHRDKLRVFGEMLGLNMEEALDRALRYGLPQLEADALAEESDDEG